MSVWASPSSALLLYLYDRLSDRPQTSMGREHVGQHVSGEFPLQGLYVLLHTFISGNGEVLAFPCFVLCFRRYTADGILTE